eukprot:CAMPEP_0205831210 /NCGR_PEP_ID=MMETSP0206-20130828/43404_1 /ASSEMBLY_ACC=CAM_ASM_000279 /TAXON_ID=36767 /ORGANISM="Euplotes focardii, Strain TN1" /LENGTH=158 /DNA_ID=CAMNT_0053135631 /DNA_START=22 /DNA_END=495 /DNA_ORIENTATION=+
MASAKQRFEEEAKDPAMVAYLKSLGLDPDYKGPADDPRILNLKQLAIVFKDGSKPQVIPLSTEKDVAAAKKTVLEIKQGCEYRVELTFRVQHDMLPGFGMKNTISSRLAKLEESVEKLGSYPPSNEFKTLPLPAKEWLEAPAGFLARGTYKCKVEFFD